MFTDQSGKESYEDFPDLHKQIKLFQKTPEAIPLPLALIKPEEYIPITMENGRQLLKDTFTFEDMGVYNWIKTELDPRDGHTTNIGARRAFNIYARDTYNTIAYLQHAYLAYIYPKNTPETLTSEDFQNLLTAILLIPSFFIYRAENSFQLNGAIPVVVRNMYKAVTGMGLAFHSFPTGMYKKMGIRAFAVANINERLISILLYPQ